MNGWQYYQTSDLAVCPYMPGTPIYQDGMLPYLYTRTKYEGKIPYVFCGDELNMDGFVTFFEKRKTLQILVKVQNSEIIPLGYCWVDNPVGVDGARSALCGFCFFKDAKQYSRSLGHLGLAYWFIDLRIDTVHGILLESNIPAKNYAFKLGFTEWGVVPDRHYHNGKLEGARVMLLRKNDFIPRFEEWFDSQKSVVATV